MLTWSYVFSANAWKTLASLENVNITQKNTIAVFVLSLSEWMMFQNGFLMQ